MVGEEWLLKLQTKSMRSYRNISKQKQIEYCKRKAKELKLDNQVSFELCDYRASTKKFDRSKCWDLWNIWVENFIKLFLKR